MIKFESVLKSDLSRVLQNFLPTKPSYSKLLAEKCCVEYNDTVHFDSLFGPVKMTLSLRETREMSRKKIFFYLQWLYFLFKNFLYFQFKIMNVLYIHTYTYMLVFRYKTASQPAFTWRRSDVFIVNSGYTLCIVLVFPLLTSNN